MKTKICNKCKVEKNLTLFSINNRRIKFDGLDTVCKKCIQDRRFQNKEIRAAQKRAWRINNPDRYKATYQRTTERHKEKIYERNNKRRKTQKVKDKRNLYLKTLRVTNENYKIVANLRVRFHDCVKKHNKRGKTLELLGCSVDFLKIYLASKFTKGMTWENYGKYGWHIDHIKPCSSFNLSSTEQQKQCFHYTNLQPLWATTAIAIKHGESSNYIGNIEKGGK